MGTPPYYAQYNAPGRLVYFSRPVRIFDWGSVFHICLLHQIVAGSTASTSLLKDGFPARSIEEVHGLVVDMQAHLSAGFHLGTRIELGHNTPACHGQVHQ
jgi:hypothetical protein